MSNSSASFVGNLTSDPQLHQSEGKKARASFRVAVNEGRDENKSTQFVSVTAFGDLAENIAASLSQGQRVLVNGRFDQYTRSVEIDGVERDMSVLTVIADAVGPDLRWATAKVTKVTRDGAAPAASQDEAKSSSKPRAKAAAKSAPAEDLDEF